MLFLGETKSPGAYLIKALFFLCIRGEIKIKWEKRYKLQSKVFFNKCLYGNVLLVCKFSLSNFWRQWWGFLCVLSCWPLLQRVHEAVLEVLDAWHLHILVFKELLDFMDKEPKNRLNMLFRKTCCTFFWKKEKPNFNLWEKNSWWVILRMIYFKISQREVLCMCLFSFKN